jgi:glycosyltransferase involved in cell wall biosynthesis
VPKILYVSSPITSSYGGGEKFTSDFIDHFSEFKHEFLGSSQAMIDLFESKGLNTTKTWAGFEPVTPKNLILFPVSIILGLVTFIRYFELYKSAEVIISPTSFTEVFFVLPWVKFFLKKKVIFQIHANRCPKVFSQTPLKYILNKLFGKSPVIFVSKSQLQNWAKIGILPENSEVIENGVKISEFQTLSKPRNEFLRFGFLSRLHFEKGVDILIDSLYLIKSKQKIEVMIGGSGEQEQVIKQKLKNKPLPNNIKLTLAGFITDTKSFFESIDIFVFPSRGESFGLVLVEAWERGLATIASNIPSLVDIKKDSFEDEQKLVFQSENADDLAQKIDFVIQSTELYTSTDYKSKLHQIVELKFDIRDTLEKYRKFL